MFVIYFFTDYKIKYDLLLDKYSDLYISNEDLKNSHRIMQSNYLRLQRQNKNKSIIRAPRKDLTTNRGLNNYTSRYWNKLIKYFNNDEINIMENYLFDYQMQEQTKMEKEESIIKRIKNKHNKEMNKLANEHTEQMLGVVIKSKISKNSIELMNALKYEQNGKKKTDSMGLLMNCNPSYYKIMKKLKENYETAKKYKTNWIRGMDYTILGDYPQYPLISFQTWLQERVTKQEWKEDYIWNAYNATYDKLVNELNLSGHFLIDGSNIKNDASGKNFIACLIRFNGTLREFSCIVFIIVNLLSNILLIVQRI